MSPFQLCNSGHVTSSPSASVSSSVQQYPPHRTVRIRRLLARCLAHSRHYSKSEPSLLFSRALALPLGPMETRLGMPPRTVSPPADGSLCSKSWHSDPSTQGVTIGCGHPWWSLCQRPGGGGGISRDLPERHGAHHLSTQTHTCAPPLLECRHQGDPGQHLGVCRESVTGLKAPPATHTHAPPTETCVHLSHTSIYTSHTYTLRTYTPTHPLWTSSHRQAQPQTSATGSPFPLP